MVRKKTSVYEDFESMEDMPVSESKTGDLKNNNTNERYSVLGAPTAEVATTSKFPWWLMFLLFLLFLFLLWLLWMLFFKDKGGNDDSSSANNNQEQQDQQANNGGGDGGAGGGGAGGAGAGGVGVGEGVLVGGGLLLTGDITDVLTGDEEVTYDRVDFNTGSIYTGDDKDLDQEDIFAKGDGIDGVFTGEEMVSRDTILEEKKRENSQKALELLNDRLSIFEDGTEEFLTGLDTQNVLDKFDDYQRYKKVDIGGLRDIVKHIDIDEKERKELEKELDDLYLLTEEFYGRDETVLPSYENKLAASLGVEKNDVEMQIQIEKGSQLPASGTYTYTTRKPYQKSMFFNIYQGEDPLTENNKYLGRLDLEGLTPIETIGPRVEVSFDLDKDGKLTISAEDILYRDNQVTATLDTEVDYVTKNIGDINKVGNFVEGMNNRVYRILEKVDKIELQKAAEAEGGIVDIEE